ncbi:MAG: hypothetical protein WBA44_13940 [Mesorhizobium sp.]
MAMRRSNIWFAALRRDRGAFAVLALIAILIQALQPLAASSLVAAGGMPVICTAMSADQEPGKSPLNHESCARCVAGACRLALAEVAVLPGEFAWATPDRQASAPVLAANQTTPDPSPPALPPGIRAPPFPA